ncbi:MAG: ABC transporter permease [bacterium]
MIKFLAKGILRDKNRSFLPIIVVSLGVLLTVFLSGWVTGVFGDMIDMNARFTTGHVKIMTCAYAENRDQLPNDLALLEIDDLKDKLQSDYPGMQWVERIYFGGLLDVPDENSETRAQAPASGQAVDLLSPESGEAQRMNITPSIVSGSMIHNQGETLISDQFANRFNVKTGDKVTIFSSTMYGSMAFKNFTVSGTVRFGTTLLDRGAVIIDIRDAREAFNMENAAGEVLGYFEEGKYLKEKAEAVKTSFNSKYSDETDEFSPVMLTLGDQEGLDEMLAYSESVIGLVIFVFVFAMSLVLWNTGLLGGLRRYGEFGVRLALGEEKNHLYKTLIIEAIIIGVIGSVIGTTLGVTISWYLQEHGVSFGSMTENLGMMMPSRFRAIVTPQLFYIGFVPGLFAMVLGNALSGIGIYKRNTAQLFKELEV